MTRSRRVVVALFTAVAMFLATLASQGTAARSTERAIRRAPPIAHTIVAYRAVNAVAKARVAADSLDTLPFVALPVSARVEVSSAQLLGRIEIASVRAVVPRAFDVATRARAPPIA